MKGYNLCSPRMLKDVESENLNLDSDWTRAWNYL